MHQNQQYHSASLHWLHIWNHSWVRIQEFIISILRHPIFHFRHSQKSQDLPSTPVATCTLPAKHSVRTAVCAVFFFYPPPSRSAVNAIMWLPKPKQNRFWPFPKPKNRFYRRNPVLETLPRAQAVEPILTRDTPTDAYSRRIVPFGVRTQYFYIFTPKPPNTPILGT